MEKLRLRILLVVSHQMVGKVELEVLVEPDELELQVLLVEPDEQEVLVDPDELLLVEDYSVSVFSEPSVLPMLSLPQRSPQIPMLSLLRLSHQMLLLSKVLPK
ncbi:MAG: hypothetical protein WCQ60_03940 [bacterium]